MQLSVSTMSPKRISSLFPMIALLWGLLPVWSAPVLAHSIGALARPINGGTIKRWSGSQAPTFTDCQAAGFICYSPQEERNAYDLTPALNRGFTGKGQTIAIIDSFGSPTALQDLQQFDTDYGLPDPPSFKVIAPLGSVPFDPSNSDQVGWAEETSLDVQWSHAMAPDANIVLLTSPVSETEGVQGLPEFQQLEEYGIAHGYTIFSQSWAATENTLFTPDGFKVLNSFNDFYKNAVLFHHATFFASTGDSGSANVEIDGSTIYPFPTVGFPSSSPWVTAVGGTSLFADANGNYQSETVWNNSIGATGGGVSQYFKEPLYQTLALSRADNKLLKGFRGVPDIASNADPATGVPVHLGFFPQGQNGYFIFGGTSESSPTWAGILADADQFAGHPISFLNQKIYLIGLNHATYAYGFHDVTVGNNASQGIPGYSATPGWDAATGWGTPIATHLFQELAF